MNHGPARPGRRRRRRRPGSARRCAAAVGRAVVLLLDIVTKVLAVKLLTPGQPVLDHRRHRDVDAGAQLRRRVLDGHRLHLGADADRQRRGGRHHLDGPAAGVAVVGDRPRHDPRRRDGQPGRPVLPLAGTAARAMSSTSCPSAGGRCSTSPTRRWWAGRSCWSCCRCSDSTSTPSGGARPATKHGDTGRSRRHGVRPNPPDGHPLDARAGRTGGHARGRRAGPAARAVPHRRGGAGRGRRRRPRRRPGRQVRPADRRRLAGGAAARSAGAAGEHAGRHRGHDDPVLRRRHRRGRQTGRGGRPRDRSAGPGRRCSAGWPPPASGSPPRASTSGRASCTASTSAPPG